MLTRKVQVIQGESKQNINISFLGAEITLKNAFHLKEE